MAGAFGTVEEHLRTKRILLVDDERELADMVATILHGAGFASVDIINASTEALAAITARSASPERAYELFVLDVMMPDMDGFDLLARIRQLPAHAATPPCSSRRRTSPSTGCRDSRWAPTTTSRSRSCRRSSCCASPPC